MASESMDTVYIENITVGSIQTTSGIFNGINSQNQWKSYEKENFGFGEVSGQSNVFIANQSFVSDPDALELYMNEKDQSKKQP